MTATTYAPIATWDATNRYTASGVTPAKINNAHPHLPLFWTTTLSDTLPSVPVASANRVSCLGTDRIELLDTERLWLAFPGATVTMTDAATIEV